MEKCLGAVRVISAVRIISNNIYVIVISEDKRMWQEKYLKR